MRSQSQKKKSERCRNQNFEGKVAYIDLPSPSHCDFVYLLQHSGSASSTTDKEVHEASFEISLSSAMTSSLLSFILFFSA